MTSKRSEGPIINQRGGWALRSQICLGVARANDFEATLGFNEASFPPPRASNAVSIVPWVLGGGNLPDLRVDQRVPAPELSHMFRGFPLTLAVKFGKLPRGG